MCTYVYTHIHTHTHTHTHTHSGRLFSLKKEENPVLCDNVVDTRGHYAKCIKPDTERQILHDLTYT